MKKVLGFILFASFFAFIACGPSGEQEAEETIIEEAVPAPVEKKAAEPEAVEEKAEEAAPEKPAGRGDVKTTDEAPKGRDAVKTEEKEEPAGRGSVKKN